MNIIKPQLVGAVEGLGQNGSMLPVGFSFKSTGQINYITLNKLGYTHGRIIMSSTSPPLIGTKSYATIYFTTEPIESIGECRYLGGVRTYLVSSAGQVTPGLWRSGYGYVRHVSINSTYIEINCMTTASRYDGYSDVYLWWQVWQ